MNLYGIDKSTASNLLSWSATLFATITLIYTYNTWRYQKFTDTLSSLSKEYYMDLSKIYEEIDVYIKEFVQNVPTIEVDIPILKKLKSLQRDLVNYKYKLNIIYSETKDKKLLVEIENIEYIAYLLGDLVFSAINNEEESKLEKENKSEYFMYKRGMIDTAYNKFITSFSSFKIEVDKILISYIFYKTK